jgi:hypothetical protein
MDSLPSTICLLMGDGWAAGHGDGALMTQIRHGSDLR